ncbi:basic salivary proline-rich protein 1-like [Homarus americanus]|uniref:basic salivary proline-rich protein 1-like n=1 Tax=Homarus americanus TaxID=6706 RepID=UPI001C44D0FE|nr:basic salivary proline-rich protein 1-like [Homarus americanus]
MAPPGPSQKRRRSSGPSQSAKQLNSRGRTGQRSLGPPIYPGQVAVSRGIPRATAPSASSAPEPSQGQLCSEGPLLGICPRGQRSHGPSHLPYQVRRPKGPSQERRRTQWPSQGRRRPQGPSLGKVRLPGALSGAMPSGGNAPMGPPICPTRCGALRGPRRNVGAPSGRPRGSDAPKDPP